MKILFSGALCPLAEEQLTKQDLLLLEILRFLCICVTTVQIQTVSFRASDIRRKLLMLTDGSVFDSAKPLHLHMVSVSFFYSRPTSVFVLFLILYILVNCIFLSLSYQSPEKTLKWLLLVFWSMLWSGKEQLEFVRQKIKRSINILPLSLIIC